MASSSCEIVNGTLFVSGSLDRAAEQEFAQGLEKYMEAVPVGSRTVDMSNVRWLAPTGAKVLIQAGQETGEKGGKMRVLASRHVMQTLSLLGAKTWLAIESCTTPTAKPGAAEAAPPAESAKAPAESPATHAAGDAPAERAAAAPAAAEPPAGMSGTQVAIVRGANALYSPYEELTGSACLLRVLAPNRRYAFHFCDGDQVIGTVRERIGGPWILVDTHGTRKMVNLNNLKYCEIL